MTAFAAIDFETADRWRDSACAVGAVLVKEGRIAGRYHQLIRPPRRSFEFTHIHGLTWADVRDSPAFGDMWPDLRRFVDDAGFLVAHNAGFDRSVLEACCAAAGVAPPGARVPLHRADGPENVEPAIGKPSGRLPSSRHPARPPRRAFRRRSLRKDRHRGPG